VNKLSKRSTYAIIVAAAVCVLLGLYFKFGPGSTHTLTGSITVTDTPSGYYGTSSVTVYGEFCSTSGGYADMQTGANVVAKDAASKIIATGSLGVGVAVGSYGCEFGFTLVVPDSEYYSIEVSHRGALTYSRDELAAELWDLSLTLGN
jgi:hypothetical protein